MHLFVVVHLYAKLMNKDILKNTPNPTRSHTRVRIERVHTRHTQSPRRHQPLAAASGDVYSIVDILMSTALWSCGHTDNAISQHPENQLRQNKDSVLPAQHAQYVVPRCTLAFAFVLGRIPVSVNSHTLCGRHEEGTQSKHGV